MKNSRLMLSFILLATIVLTAQTISVSTACEPEEPQVVFSCLVAGESFLTWNTLMAPPRQMVVDEQVVHIEPYIGPAVGSIACVGSAAVGEGVDGLYIAEPGSVRCIGFLGAKWAQNGNSYAFRISFHSTELTFGAFVPEHDYFQVGQVQEERVSWDQVLRFEGTIAENGERQQIWGIAIQTVASGEYDPTGVIPQDTKFISFAFFIDLEDDVWLPVTVTWVDQELTLPWDPGWGDQPEWFNEGPFEEARVFCHRVWLRDSY